VTREGETIFILRKILFLFENFLIIQNIGAKIPHFRGIIRKTEILSTYYLLSSEFAAVCWKIENSSPSF